MLKNKSNRSPQLIKTYQEKLQDPRWQRARLAVLNRADFTCQGCGSKDKTLQVHHGYYERGLDPWQHPLDTMWCLCNDCHEEAEKIRLVIYRKLAKLHPLRVSEGIIVPPERAISIQEVLQVFAAHIISVEPSAEDGDSK